MNLEKNPILEKVIEPENNLKAQLVEYVGDTLKPEDNNVTVAMIIEVLSKEFPEVLLAMAEENWILGYQQAMADTDSTKQVHKKIENG